MENQVRKLAGGLGFEPRRTACFVVQIDGSLNPFLSHGKRVLSSIGITVGITVTREVEL